MFHSSNKLLVVLLTILTFSHAMANQVVVSERALMFRLQQEQKNIQAAFELLDKRPELVVDIMDPREYKFLKDAYSSGKLEEYLEKERAGSIQIGKDTFQLQPASMRFFEFAESIEAYDDEENIKTLYTRLYNALPSKYQAEVTAATRVERLSLALAKRELHKLMVFTSNISIALNTNVNIPAGWTQDCSKEIGADPSVPANRGDWANRCSPGQFHPTSLFRRTNFPLKYYHTCIKNQGRRGTCVAFAINSMVEAKLMLKEGKAYNFSQQFTFLNGKIKEGGSRRYLYGLDPAKTLKNFKKDETKFEYERFWEYNTSFSMSDTMDSNNKYPGSCTNYVGQTCTGYSFQTKETITGTFSKTRTYTVPFANTDKSVRIKGHNTIKGPLTTKRAALKSAITLLNDGEPVHVSYEVQKNFKDTTADGVVRYSRSSAAKGGHSSMLIGFVPNAQLPSGFPKASEEGYFILKNSWHTSNGDCGYYYVDFEYLRRNLNNLYTISI
jgi:hypothetical protein